MGLGQRIAEARRGAGLSQTELARRSGVGQATISRLEATDSGATSGVLDKLATALGVPVVTFFPQTNEAGRLLPRTMEAIPANASASVLDTFDRQVEGIARLIFGGPHSPNPLPDRRDDGDAVNANGVEGGDGYLNRHSQTRNNSLFGHDRLPVLDAA